MKNISHPVYNLFILNPVKPRGLDMAIVSFPSMNEGSPPREELDPSGINFDGLAPVFLRMLGDQDLIRPLKKGLDFLDSGPFLNVCVVSLKNAPFAFYGNHETTQEFDSAISCGIRFLEAAMMATASLVYNVVFATVFSLLSFATMGKVKLFTDQMHKQWMHTALAAAAVAIGIVGTFSPQLGILANLKGGIVMTAFLLDGVEQDLIRGVCNVYHRYARILKATTLRCIQGNAELFDREFAPLFRYLDRHLRQSVRRDQSVEAFPDLIRVVQGAREQTNFNISISSQALGNMISSLLRQLSIHPDSPEQTHERSVSDEEEPVEMEEGRCTPDSPVSGMAADLTDSPVSTSWQQQRSSLALPAFRLPETQQSSQRRSGSLIGTHLNFNGPY